MATSVLLLATVAALESGCRATPLLRTTSSTQIAVTKGVEPTESGWYVHTQIGDMEKVINCHVRFTDTLHGWLIGSTGSEPALGAPLDFGAIALATQDGGSHWSRQNLPESMDWSCIHFIDPQRGWVVGSELVGKTIRPLILATSDGGATWTHQQAENGLGPLEVFFVDSQHGWIVAETLAYDTLGLENTPGVIISTTDGGVTWSRQLTTDTYMTGIWFVDANHGWAVGKAGTILATVDGGRNWTRQDYRPDETRDGIGNPTDAEDADFYYAVSFADPLHGWVVSPTRIIATRDGGAHWATEHSQPPLSSADESRTPFSAVSCPDVDHVWSMAGRNLLARVPGWDGE